MAVMSTLLLLFPSGPVADNVADYLSDNELIKTSSASDAIAAAEQCDAVIMELSLAGHSGFEFLYELRSYADLQKMPVIIFSRLQLTDEVLHSRSFKALNVIYLYQPTTTLAQLKMALEKEIAT